MCMKSADGVTIKCFHLDMNEFTTNWKSTLKILLLLINGKVAFHVVKRKTFESKITLYNCYVRYTHVKAKGVQKPIQYK